MPVHYQYGKDQDLGLFICTTEKQSYQHDEPVSIIISIQLPRNLGVKVCMEPREMLDGVSDPKEP